MNVVFNLCAGAICWFRPNKLLFDVVCLRYCGWLRFGAIDCDVVYFYFKLNQSAAFLCCKR